MSIKRYRFRAYPSKGQAQAIAQLFGCTRVVYNKLLEANIQCYKTSGKKLSPTEINDLARQLKIDNPWLADVSSVPLQQARRHLDRAYDNFFKPHQGKRRGPKVGLPRFKKRSTNQSATFTLAAFKLRTTTHGVGFVRLAKIGEVRFVLSRDFPSQPKTVTLIRETTGHYYVSFTVDTSSLPQPAYSQTDSAVGIDVGLTDLATVVSSDGHRYKVANPRYYCVGELKIQKLSRRLSKQQRGSHRYRKTQQGLARTHAKIRHQRQDHAYRLARRIVDNNHVIALETLNIKGMVRTRLAKSINDAGWRQLIRCIEEKAAEAHRRVVFINQWEPTSQTCAVCGTRDGKKPLNIRIWTCNNCGITLDRDYNAAVNILAAGHAESLNGRGGNVRLSLAQHLPTKRQPTESLLQIVTT